MCMLTQPEWWVRTHTLIKYNMFKAFNYIQLKDYYVLRFVDE